MKKGALLVLILLIGCVQSEDTVELSYEEYNELEDKEICGEGMHEYGDEAKIICVECFEVEHCDPDYYCEDFKCKQAPEEVYEEEIVKDPKLEGIGTCTLREECMEMLGDGAFCSKGTCYPPPDDHVKDQVECTCPDGTVVKAQLDCKYADCPGEPTEFTIKDGIVSKAIVSVSFPLLGKEAKKAAVAGCGISFEVNAPSSAYENVIPECDSAWEFKDATNPCSHKRAFVCDNKAFASCIFGGETEGAICIDGEPLEQGEFHEKFIREIITCGFCLQKFDLGSNELQISCGGCDKFFHCHIGGKCRGENCSITMPDGSIEHISYCLNCCDSYTAKNGFCICNNCSKK